MRQSFTNFFKGNFRVLFLKQNVSKDLMVFCMNDVIIEYLVYSWKEHHQHNALMHIISLSFFFSIQNFLDNFQLRQQTDSFLVAIVKQHRYSHPYCFGVRFTRATSIRTGGENCGRFGCTFFPFCTFMEIVDKNRKSV